MNVLSAALFTTMVADGALCANLGLFSGGPSIFTKPPVPSTATRPIVVAMHTISDVDEDMLTEKGRVILRDIGVYGNAPIDNDKVINAADRVHDLFHRVKNLVVSGWRCPMIVATGPISAPVGDQEIGRIITLRIRLHEP